MTTALHAILLVDDEVGFLDVMGRRLRRRGIEVALAASGAEALDAVRGGHFDAVVTDLKMPGMDGLSLMDELRLLQPEMPVILLTGHAGKAEAQDAQRRGVAGYLHKPCDFDELLAVLRHVTDDAL